MPWFGERYAMVLADFSRFFRAFRRRMSDCDLRSCPTSRATSLTGVSLFTLHLSVSTSLWAWFMAEASQVPHKRHPHMLRVFDSGEPSQDSRLSPCFVLPSHSPNVVGVPNFDFGAQYRAYAFPCQRLVAALTNRSTHDSGFRWLATPFRIEDFHLQSLASLSWRTSP